MQCLASVAVVTVLCLGAGNTAFAAPGPSSGLNGQLAVVKNSMAGTFLGSLSLGGRFHPLYEEWDYNLGGSDVTFSPSGSRLALSIGWRPSQLAVARVSDGNLRYVDTRGIDVSEPSWAANGRIGFTGHRSGRRSTYSIRPDGRGLHKLFNRPIYAASRDLDAFVGASKESVGHHLELINRKGERVSMLARNKKYFFVDPTISPDGRWIVYGRYPVPPGMSYGVMRANLYVVRRDGAHRRRLTRGMRDRFPTFSPDGRWIAFARYDRRGFSSNVAVLRLDHPGRVRRITHTKKTYYQEVSWGKRHQR